MSERSIIFAGLAIYIAIMAVVGIYAARRTHSSTEFVLAGRSLSLGLCTTTIIATWFGGGMLLGGSGAAYEEGLLGVIADPFGAALCLLLTGMFFVRIFRRLKFFSFIEFVEQRFGRLATLVTSAAALMSSIFWVAGMLVAFGLIFESLTGTPLEVGIVGGAIVVVLYTSIGGMLAVALTDFIQILIIAIGVVLLFGVVLHDAGGWGTVYAQIPDSAWRMAPLEHTGERWLNYLRAWFIFGLADIASQSLLQRAMAAKNERVAQNSFYLASAGYLGFALIPIVLGIIASVTMPGLEDAESVLPALAIEHLHPVAIAIFVGALLAAIMSSADSALLASASIFSVNLMPVFTRKPISDRKRLLATRVAIPVIGTAAVYVALEVQVVYDLVQDANSALLVSVVIPFVCGIWWKKANRTGALAAMGVGFLTWILAILFEPGLPGDMLGLITCLVTMFTVTALTQKFDPPVPLRNSDGEEVELKDRLGTLPLFRRIAQPGDRPSQAGVS